MRDTPQHYNLSPGFFALFANVRFSFSLAAFTEVLRLLFCERSCGIFLFTSCHLSRRSFASLASSFIGPIISEGFAACDCFGCCFGFNRKRLPSNPNRLLPSWFLNCLRKLERKFENISPPLSTCIKGIFCFFFRQFLYPFAAF